MVPVIANMSGQYDRLVQCNFAVCCSQWCRVISLVIIKQLFFCWYEISYSCYSETLRRCFHMRPVVHFFQTSTQGSERQCVIDWTFVVLRVITGAFQFRGYNLIRFKLTNWILYLLLLLILLLIFDNWIKRCCLNTDSQIIFNCVQFLLPRDAL